MREEEMRGETLLLISDDEFQWKIKVINIHSSGADPESADFLPPGSGITGTGNFVLPDLGSRICLVFWFLWNRIRTRDPGCEILHPRSGIKKTANPDWGYRIRNKYPGSATRIHSDRFFLVKLMLGEVTKTSFEYDFYLRTVRSLQKL
jgi:hypothetical protein